MDELKPSPQVASKLALDMSASYKNILACLFQMYEAKL